MRADRNDRSEIYPQCVAHGCECLSRWWTVTVLSYAVLLNKSAE